MNDIDKSKLLEEIDSLVGCSEVKGYLRRLIMADSLPGFEQQRKLFVIEGNPGTGKTTIAKLIGKVLGKCGFLANENVVNVNRCDLVSEYVGQTSVKTEKCLDRAMGGTLIVDEPDSLWDDFGREALCVLLDQSIKHSGKLAVVLMGYPGFMENIQKMDASLPPRINYFLIDDYTAEELAMIFRNNCRELHFNIDEKLDSGLEVFFRNYKDYKSKAGTWGNARECYHLIALMRGNWLKNNTNANVDNVFTVDYIPDDLKSFL